MLAKILFPMQHWILSASCITCFFFAQAQPEKRLFLGTLGGDGHNCHGKFAVTEKWLTWNAPFDKCVHVPYTVIKQKRDKGNTFIEFQINDPAKCSFSVITMEQNENTRLGWSVRGFTHESGLKNDIDDLGCLLY